MYYQRGKERVVVVVVVVVVVFVVVDYQNGKLNLRQKIENIISPL